MKKMVHCMQYDFRRLQNMNLNDLKSKRDFSGNNIYYYNYPFSFDIETSSFYVGEVKRATMYIFMFSLNGDIIYGRTWDEFNYVITQITNELNLNPTKRIIIYVHNLSYEFQFLQQHIEISDVFARETRHPIKFTGNGCIDFKCSYFLTGLSLEKTAETLTNIEIKKQIGFLDYELIRHSETPLTIDELKYCEYDVLILHYVILSEMKNNGGDITKIPLTKTGYVRRYCQQYIRKNTNWTQYRKRIIKCAPLNEQLFILLNKSFQGGFTHANFLHVGETLNNVGSIDFTSSYPAQMVLKKYPMTPFIQWIPQTRNEFDRLVNKYACIMEIMFTNVTAKNNNHIISYSKCICSNDTVTDNGRIVNAEQLVTYITDIDYKNICAFYNFDKISIKNMYISTYDYLPKQLIECVLKFFNDKTTLKGIAGKEDEYQISKGMLNSTFGMCVTNPVNDEITFNGEWGRELQDIETALYNSYVKNKKQFLLYQWGVWITAHARNELFNGVLKIGDDVVYCDTDSIKFINPDKYTNYIQQYNNNIIENLKRVLNLRGIDYNLAFPKNIKNEIKILGVWEYECTYNRFKTLGAKRYAFEIDDKFNITVSGLNKKSCVPYILSQKIDPFDFFNNSMYIPPKFNGASATGKTTMTYIDDPYKYKLTDYLGNTTTVQEFSYIHAEPQEYNLSLSGEFLDYLCGNNYIDFTVKQQLFKKHPKLKINKWD